MKTKSCRAQIKSVTTDPDEQGQFTALVSVFGNTDSYGDVVMPGAFAKTLADWATSGDPIPVVWSHMYQDPNMHIGTVTTATETDAGLEVTAQLDMDNPNAAQVYKLLKGRRVKQFSFSYDVVEGRLGKRDGQDVYELHEVKLYEVGPTPIGANPATELIDVKAREQARPAYEFSPAEQAALEYGPDQHAMRALVKQALDITGRLDAAPQTPRAASALGTLRAELAAVAELAGKSDLTPADLTAAREHLAKATRIEKDLTAMKNDAAVMAQARELAAAIGPQAKDTPGTDHTGAPTAPAVPEAKHTHPRVKATGGSTWGAALLRATTDQAGHIKGILTPGSIPVTVPLNPEPVRMGEPVLSMRQLIPTAANASGRFAYLRQTVRTNNAAPVAAGARKPTSIFTTQRIDDRVRTIAHLSEPINKFDLADAPMLQDFIDSEMRLGLETALDNQIINGNGTGENFTGLANVSGSQTQAFTTDILTTTRKAVTLLEAQSLLDGAAWVVNPTDWETIELLQDANDRFYYGGPITAVDRASRRLWSIPVVTATGQTQGTAHLVDFKGSTELHVTEEGILDWSENVYRPDLFGAGDGGSTFEANQIVFRFEGRFGLAIKRPLGIVEVDLTA